MAEKIDLRPKVLEIIQNKGPVIPRELVKELGGDTFIIGAVLMQLKEAGKILVTNTKVGGSPAYYCEGQEEKLQNLEKYLNEKEKYAYNLLKEGKVLRDYSQATVVRLSLRLIKDFSIPLVVEVNGEDEIFWKWYLTPLSDAEEIIKEIIPTIKPEVSKEVDIKEENEATEILIKEEEQFSNNTEEKQEITEDITEEIIEPIHEEKRQEAIIQENADDSDEENKTFASKEEVKEATSNKEEKIEIEKNIEEKEEQKPKKVSLKQKLEKKKIEKQEKVSTKKLKIHKPKTEKKLKKEKKHVKRARKNISLKHRAKTPKKESIFKRIKKFFS